SCILGSGCIPPYPELVLVARFVLSRQTFFMRRLCRLLGLLIVGLSFLDGLSSRNEPGLTARADDSAPADEASNNAGPSRGEVPHPEPIPLEMPAVQALLTTHCADCHGGGADEG